MSRGQLLSCSVATATSPCENSATRRSVKESKKAWHYRVRRLGLLGRDWTSNLGLFLPRDTEQVSGDLV